jgi:two-component system sensor histidine kinase TctE
LRPLKAIGDELAERRPSDLHPIAAPVPSEVAPLVGSLNGFMLRLRANIDTLRGFIGDAAHQLRTPLAALLAQAQLAADDDPAELGRSLEAIERNAKRLIRLVNQLLSDATVQHRSDVRRFESFDLVEVVRHAVRESVPISEDSDVRFTTALAEARFVGDALMMGEIVKNLVHNALRHGRGENGEVCVDLSAIDGGYCLGVGDRGPGIPEADRERVFERFARGDSSSPGAGLGLAIVRDALASQGGTIALGERQGGGLQVEVRLPGNSG